MFSSWGIRLLRTEPGSDVSLALFFTYLASSLKR